MPEQGTNRRHAWVQPTADYGPLILFLVAYWRLGLLPATAVLLAATAIGVALRLVLERRLPMMPLVTAAVVGVFGGLTLWLDDPIFIKMKPTIVEALFAVVLLGGLALRRPLLAKLLGGTLALDDEGWRRLTFRYGIFFLAMAVLNEIVWRTQETSVWVGFKVFGLTGLTLLFSFAQIPLLRRHLRPETGAGDQTPTA